MSAARPAKRAIILAAGRGNRLNGHGPVRGPKSLLEVGGRTLLEWQVGALASVGVEQVVVVIGYEALYTQRRAAQICGRLGVELTTVCNPEWQHTNTLCSLARAAEYMDEPFYTLNGDVLFGPQLLHRLVTSPADAAIAVDVRACGAEEIKVTVDDAHRIHAISKEVPTGAALGEAVGIARYGVASGKALAASLLLHARDPAHQTAYFERALEAMVHLSPLHAVIVDDPVVEIDFPEDLVRARAEVLPSLLSLASPADKQAVGH